MANYPTFNPNQYNRYSAESRKNRAVNLTYEPGSTFKIVTTVAALEEGLTTPDERIDCENGSIVIFGHRIRDHKPFGVLSVTESMQYSSDVCMIKLGLRLGDQRMEKYMRKLGFGRLTGIDLEGDEDGQLAPLSKWSRVSIGAISMGQEVAVTPLQLAGMVSAVANGGTLYRPYVVQKIVHPVNGTVETKPSGERVISPPVVQQLQDMLEQVVVNGTARSAQLDGYRAAGKTGTAEKYDPKTRAYSTTKHVASFAGFAPVSNPELTIVVVIDEPVGAYHGGEVAAPVFKRIADQVLRGRSVLPDLPSYPPQHIARPEETPGNFPAPRYRQPEPDWKVVDAALETVEAHEVGDIPVPNFLGMPAREASDQAAALGFKILISGSGRAVSQRPQAGVRLRHGARIQVHFSTQ
jgi:cell division protein FtsI/penicillin-binding protein 2